MGNNVGANDRQAEGFERWQDDGTGVIKRKKEKQIRWSFRDFNIPADQRPASSLWGDGHRAKGPRDLRIKGFGGSHKLKNIHFSAIPLKAQTAPHSACFLFSPASSPQHTHLAASALQSPSCQAV